MNKLASLLLGFLIAALVLFAFFYPSSNKQQILPINQTDIQIINNEMQVANDIPSSTSSTELQADIKANSISQLLNSQIEKNLGRKANYKINYKKSLSNHFILCGVPTEINGDPFNFAQSLLAERQKQGTLDRQFCALVVQDEKLFKLIEFEIGSPDSSLYQWLEIHKIPLEILS